MDDTNDFNRQIIEEFRANDGVVGGPFEGAPLLLLHTTGAKSGTERVHPLMYRQVGEQTVIFASKAGAPSHPAWYHNLLTTPAAEIEIGKETISVTARIATGAEREQIWSDQKRDVPQFADYEAATDREIPVVVLERVS